MTLPVGPYRPALLLRKTGTTVRPASDFYVLGFRGRNDDGDEASATWKAALNEEWSQVADSPPVVFRVRMVLESRREVHGLRPCRLQYSVNGEAWVDVTQSSVAKVQFGGGASGDTTQQLSTGDFVTPNDGWRSTAVGGLAVGGTARWVGADLCEYEWTLRLNAAYVSPGDWVGSRVIERNGDVVPHHKVVPGCWVDGAPPAGDKGDPNQGSGLI